MFFFSNNKRKIFRFPSVVWIGSDLDLPWLNECKWETAPREPPSKRMNGAKTRLEQALVASPRLPRLAWSLNSWKVPVSPSFKAKLSLNSWTFGTSESLDSVSFCKERETTQNGSSPFVSPFPPQMLPSKKTHQSWSRRKTLSKK